MIHTFQEPINTIEDYYKRLNVLKDVYENHAIKGDFFIFEGVRYGTGYKKCKRQGLKDIHCDLIDDVLGWFLKPYEGFVFKYLDSDNINYEVVFLCSDGVCEISGYFMSWQMHEVQKNKKIKKTPVEYRHGQIIRLFIQGQLKLTDVKIKTVYAKK